MAGTPASSRGSFNGGTITEALIVDAAGSNPFRVAGANDHTVDVYQSGGNRDKLQLSVFASDPSGPALYVEEHGGGAIAQFVDATKPRVQITPGECVFAYNVVPAAQPGASEFCLWLDDDNVTPALKIKAKTANGTVKTATILLS